MKELHVLDGCWGEYYSVGDHVNVYMDDAKIVGICEVCRHSTLPGPFHVIGIYLGHDEMGNRVRDVVKYDTPKECEQCGAIQSHFFLLCKKHSKFGEEARVKEVEEAPRFLTRVRDNLQKT